MSETKTVGTIGQMYENRKTGKIGKLVEMNDKFKTLLMESPDGGTFNISFASLKSNWRKAKESVEDVEQAEVDSLNQLTVEEDKSKSNSNIVEFETTDVVKNKTANSTGTLFDSVLHTVLGLMEQVDDEAFSISILKSRRAYALKIGKSNVFEIYTRSFKHSFEVFMKEDFFSNVNWSEEVKPNSYDVTYNPDYRLTTHFFVNADNLGTVITDIVPVIKSFIQDYNNSKTMKKEDN